MDWTDWIIILENQVVIDIIKVCALSFWIDCQLYWKKNVEIEDVERACLMGNC